MSGTTADDALEETFHAAADHLGQLVSAHPTAVLDSVKLQLYGLYKQATVGKCTSAKPAFWDRAAHLKW
jgi:acyl-CoA-binding protein